MCAPERSTHHGLPLGVIDFAFLEAALDFAVGALVCPLEFLGGSCQLVLRVLDVQQLLSARPEK